MSLREWTKAGTGEPATSARLPHKVSFWLNPLCSAVGEFWRADFLEPLENWTKLGLPCVRGQRQQLRRDDLTFFFAVFCFFCFFGVSSSIFFFVGV